MGNTLSGRLPQSSSQAASSKGKEKATPPEDKRWGSGGQTLASRNTTVPSSFRDRERGAGGAPVPKPPNRRVRSGKQKEKENQKARSPTPDFGVDEEDVIVIDSD